MRKGERLDWGADGGGDQLAFGCRRLIPQTGALSGPLISLIQPNGTRSFAQTLVVFSRNQPLDIYSLLPHVPRQPFRLAKLALSGD